MKTIGLEFGECIVSVLVYALTAGTSQQALDHWAWQIDWAGAGLTHNTMRDVLTASGFDVQGESYSDLERRTLFKMICNWRTN